MSGMPTHATAAAGRLAGKRMLISGIGSGVGAATLRAVCAEGARVAGCDRTEGAAERAASEMREQGHDVHGMTADLLEPGAAKEWVDWAAATLGGIDVLHNNAAAAEFAPFEEMTREVWDDCIRGDLDLTYDVTVAAWTYLMRDGGSVIISGSVSGVYADGTLRAAAHMAAKAGLIGLTRQLAAEGGKHKIRVNCVSAGALLTAATDDQPLAFKRYFAGRTFLGRMGTADDIVPAIVYFASDESSYATGSNLVIDGGWSAGTPPTDLDLSEA